MFSRNGMDGAQTRAPLIISPALASVAFAWLASIALCAPVLRAQEAGAPPPPPEAQGRAPDGPGRAHGPDGPGRRGAPRSPGLTTQDDALRAVQRAYDQLRAVAPSGQTGGSELQTLPTEGRSAYETALTRYRAGSFASARQYAAAAGDLAMATESLQRGLSSGASGAMALTPPPALASGASDAYRRKMESLRVSQHAIRVDSLVRSLPANAPSAAQARRLSALGVSLAQRAEQSANSRDSATSRAPDGVMRAADATSRAAEKLYGEYYVSRGSVPPMPAAPSGGPDGMAAAPGPVGAAPPPPER